MMSENKIKIIAVIGGEHASPEDLSLAEEIGRELARQGATLVCGGLGGIMEAACKGASSEGGVTIGILPGNNHRQANPYVRIPIVTNIGYARNIIVVQTARAVIAIDGSYGTLSEIAHARQLNIPVIGLNTWVLSKDNQQDDSIIRAKTPTEAVKQALEAASD